MSNIPYRENAVPVLTPHGFSRLHYYEWGDADNRSVVFCVHGLTRNGRDFDALAQALAPTHRVICPDMPGRGNSEWLRDPNDYVFPTYAGVLAALIARADPRTLGWVGTSMGGLLGIVLAAQAGTPIGKLVVNDIGPVLEPAAVTRIAGYVGADPAFASFADLEAHIRFVSAPFGPLTDAQWRHLSATTARRLPDGRWALKYDPGIAVPFRSAEDQSAALWALWDAVTCPTLLLRGARSDLLSLETARAMSARGPKPAVVEVPGVGHAPMLMDPSQIAPVVEFLRG